MRVRLLSPPRRWLKDNDPCYVELARVVHIGLGLALAIAIGMVAEHALGLGQPLAFPMFVALGAGAHLSFLMPSTPRRELADLGRISVLTLGFVLLTALIGPGSLPLGMPIMKSLLVPTTFVALYIRRFGPAYHRAGLALFITAMIAAATEPTQAQGWWLLLAAAGGTAIAYLLRLAPWRPSAARGFERVLTSYRQVLTDVLTALANELATERPVRRELRGVVPRLRRRVRMAAIAATAEQPGRQPAFDLARSIIYRVQIAVAILLEAAPDPSPDVAVSRLRRQLAQAVTAVRDRVAMGPDPGLATVELHAALAHLNEAIVSLPLADERQRYDLLRAAAALGRVLVSITELDRVLTRPGAMASQPVRDVAASPSRAGLLPTTRVACQGLVATTITTALDLGLGLNHAYWATLTVLLVLGSSFGETVLRARHRTLGSFVGALLGIALVELGHGYPWTLAGLCLLLQMLGALTAQRRYQFSAAAIAGSVVVGLHLLGGVGPSDMLARIYETGIGAAVALLASRLVLPVYGGDEARRQIGDVLARCRAAFAAWWPRQRGAGVPEAPSRLVRDLGGLEERLPHLNAEAVLGHRSAAEVVRVASYLRVLQSYLYLVEHAATKLADAGDLGPAMGMLTAFRAAVLAAFDHAAGGGQFMPGAEHELARHAAAGTAAFRQQMGRGATLEALVEYTFYGEALARSLQGLGEALAGRPPVDEAHARRHG